MYVPFLLSYTQTHVRVPIVTTYACIFSYFPS